MASRTLIVLFAVLCGTQVYAGLLDWNAGNGLLSQYADKIKSWQSESQQKIASHRNEVKTNLEAAIGKIRNEIKQKVADGEEKAKVAQECWQQHQEEIKAIEKKFEAESKKCVDDNIGPASKAAQKLKDDLNQYTTRTQEQLKEAQKCGFNFQCYRNVTSQIAQEQKAMGQQLLADRTDLEQKSRTSAAAIESCEKDVVSVEKAAAIKEVKEAVQKCIEEKQNPQTTQQAAPAQEAAVQEAPEQEAPAQEAPAQETPAQEAPAQEAAA